MLLLLSLLSAHAQEAPPAPSAPDPSAPDEGADAPEAPAPAPTGQEGPKKGPKSDAPDAPTEDLPIIKGPEILEYVEAEWPPGTKEAGEEAVVKLVIELDETGEVASVDIVEPAGRGFDEAAVDAVLAMKFAPAETEAGPVPVVFEFAYGFRFEEEPPEEAPKPVNLEGRIREMGTRVDLAGVTVVVDGTDLSAKTDAEGRFEIRGVPLGDVTLRLLEQDHVTIEKTVEVVEGEVTIVDLWLRSTSYRDNEVVGVYERKKEEVTRRTITIEEVRRIPGTFGDPIKVIQTLPGAARTPFGTGLLVIRGSNPEDSGVYVDGVRLPIIYHLTGTTSVLSPDLIESVDYLPGGYGVQYGRSMGGVVDIRTKREFSEQGKIVWGTDILDSQVYFEGQIGSKKKPDAPKHQIAIAARRSYLDLFIPIFTRESQFKIKPFYTDYQAKYIAPTPGDQHVSAFFYGFEDILKVSTPDDFAQGTDQDTQGDLKTKYASQRLMFTYENEISDKLVFAASPSLGYDYSNLGLGDEFKLQSKQLVGQLRAELRYTPVTGVEIIPGVDFLGGTYWFDFRSAINLEAASDPLAEREPVGFDGRGSFLSPDLFIKANLRPLGGDDRLLITPGVRFNNYTIFQGGEIIGDKIPPSTTYQVDPRILSRFEIVKGNTIKAATGFYQQPPQPQEALGLGQASSVGYERAWNSSIGFEQQLSPAIKWDIDLFYKKFDNLIVYNDQFSGRGSDAFINGGDGRAYGMEIMARHEPVGRFFGWISYTLSRSERKDGPDQDVYLFDFDQTHIFSAQAGYDLPYDFGISAQAQYVTGNPDSPYNAGIYDADADYYNGFSTGGRNTERLPAFFQTSLRLDKLWTFKTWQFETYVDLLNAVRGVNPEFRIYNYDYSDSAFVRGLPFIPNVGLEAKFWL
ncbi:MAG: TonB family protein [Alphaproteobacteria bacterium]|nr:TonB family protein [Alphaproteobacteria bacterium]